MKHARLLSALAIMCSMLMLAMPVFAQDEPKPVRTLDNVEIGLIIVGLLVLLLVGAVYAFREYTRHE